jgi:3-isopropylmalate dehydrogenase
MTESANFGPHRRAVYQTGHGAAYDLAGTDRANPVGQIRSLATLLQVSFGWRDAARAISAAIGEVLASGVRPADLATGRSTVVGTRELGRRIAAAAAARMRSPEPAAASHR